MASSTTNKKEIVDFLWEWSESNGDWAKLLVHKVVNTESSLENSDREEIFKYFLESIGLEKNLPKISFSKPSYSPTEQHIELKSLSDVTGVNKLAKNQNLVFSPNITVVYGENGTGKTGYCRILKDLGFSYDSSNIIYSNVFDESQQVKSASIGYRINGNSKTFVWNGNNREKYLENVSVFNSNCVQISLDETRQLIVSPIGFNLFSIVSDELKQLNSLLQSKKSDYIIELPWTEKLHEDSVQYQFVKGLSKESTVEDLNELSKFSQEHETDLLTKKNELANLNKSLLQSEIKSLQFQCNELLEIKDKVKKAKNTLNLESYNKLISINKEIIELEKTKQKGIKEIATGKGIEYYETSEFKEFLSSAEAYIKLLEKPKYPEDGDVCIYCRQPLEDSAKELLSNYRLLLNNRSEEMIDKLEKQKAALISRVKNLVDASLTLNYESFGVDEKGKAVQPQKLKKYNQQLGNLKEMFVADKVKEDYIFRFKYDNLIDFLDKEKKQIEIKLKEKDDILKNLDKREKKLKRQIDELEDRKLISTKKEEVKKIIKNYKIRSLLESQSRVFNTSSISRKTSEARDELVSQNFNEIFQYELKALRKSNLPIELSFGTERGKSKLSHRIGNKQLMEILSEGEQKAIALAEFLTELQLDNIKAPVIFDDPVNSLDHKIIDAVAKRMMRLGEERQVVIFTHSVLLFNSLLYLSGRPNFKMVSSKFYDVKQEYGEMGVVAEAEEKKNKVKANIRKINDLLNKKSQDRTEADVAIEGYNNLRSAIELFVEYEIFQNTVKRYQRNISLSNLIKVEGNKIDTHKEMLNDIFERACGFTDAHSNPEIIHDDPTIEDLKTDFDEFQKIRKDFI